MPPPPRRPFVGWWRSVVPPVPLPAAVLAMSQVPTIADGVARLTVGAGTEEEAIAMGRAYLERRGWRTGTADVLGTFRPKIGVIGYRAWRLRVVVERKEAS